ncbi:MAG: DUF433 domain-containing protein [Candidatus Omnitrophica bacterium]|nr:DUF433 domain-containing protein [Candidatus Omnitrophota bacterium]
MVDFQKYLSLDPQVHHGKPCFRGTRIPVYVVLELLEGGVRPEEIVGQDYYPELTLDHVRAALHFAVDFAKNQEYLPFVEPR